MLASLSDRDARQQLVQLLPIDFSYRTVDKVTFALGRTV